MVESIEYRTVDKSQWARGEWDDEPDKLQWQDAATRYPCLIVRGRSGALCGYVGVSEGHPAFGVNYNDVPAPLGSEEGYFPSVHGGLTFSDFCSHGDEDRAICHLPAPGESDRVWWLGFDCAHSGDVCPTYSHLLPTFHEYESYKSLAYVRAQVAGLAGQLHTLAKRGATP